MLETSRRYIFSLLCVVILSLTVIAQKYTEHMQSVRNAELAATEMAILMKRSLRSANVEQLRCMANNIYHEAGSEPFMGQVAVARVVMNRIRHGFASSPCSVIHQKTKITDEESNITKTVCQFSWVCEGKGTPSRNMSYKQAEEIARRVLVENKWADAIPGNVLFFHQTSANPGWSYKKTMTIGNHVFYSSERKR